MAQMQASKGLLSRITERRKLSMGSVIGGRGGLERFPACMRSSPLSDQLMRVWLSSDSGGGHPWAKCHARTLARYLRVVEIETGSKGVPSA